MRWSWKLGQVAGIGIYMHWTFLLLLAWVAGAYLMAGEGWEGALQGIVFILAVFACVVLHELGHALTAKRYHVRTLDITLLPIGGVARLERIPRDPTQEFWIAVAGPAVNVVIAAVLVGVIFVLGQAEHLYSVGLVAGQFLTNLMWVNVALVLFNMLPAFPMDGGRVLRALLARRLSYARATQVAATVGQLMAVFFAVAGLFVNPLLLFIALFVYIGARAESHMAQLSEVLEGVPVRDAMITQFRTVASSDPLRAVVQDMVSGWQHDFPVVDEGRLAGMLQRGDIVRALHEGRQDAPVGKYMREECVEIDDDQMLEDALMQMQLGQCSTLPVVRDGQLVGLLSSDNINHWLSLRQAQGGSSRHAMATAAQTPPRPSLSPDQQMQHHVHAPTESAR